MEGKNYWRLRRFSLFYKYYAFVDTEDAQTDNVLLLYLRKVAELKKYPPAAFRSCKGIMALEKTFGLERLGRQAHAPHNCSNTNIRK